MHSADRSAASSEVACYMGLRLRAELFVDGSARQPYWRPVKSRVRSIDEGRTLLTQSNPTLSKRLVN